MAITISISIPRLLNIVLIRTILLLIAHKLLRWDGRFIGVTIVISCEELLLLFGLEGFFTFFEEATLRGSAAQWTSISRILLQVGAVVAKFMLLLDWGELSSGIWRLILILTSLEILFVLNCLNRGILVQRHLLVINRQTRLPDWLVPLRAVGVRLLGFGHSAMVVLLYKLEFAAHDGPNQFEHMFLPTNQVMSQVKRVLFILIYLINDLFGFKAQLVSKWPRVWLGYGNSQRIICQVLLQFYIVLELLATNRRAKFQYDEHFVLLYAEPKRLVIILEVNFDFLGWA